jgi:hypothetical protein
MSGPGKQDDKTEVFKRSMIMPPDKPGGPVHAKLICLDPSRLPEPEKGLEVDLTGGEKVIGRSEENEVHLNATGISKRHARLYFSDGAWRIEDLGSTNGVFVNDAKVKESPLTAGDTIRIGKVPFQFVFVRPDIKGIVEKDGSEHDPNFDPDKTVSERTMFVGSNLMAAAMLLDAKNKQDAEKAPRPAAARAGAPVAAAVAAGAAHKKKGMGGKIVGLVILLAAIGGVVYWFGGFSRGPSQEELIQHSWTEIKRFVNNYEDSAAGFSKNDMTVQGTVLVNLQAGLADAASQFPESADIKALRAKVLFLSFERKLRMLFQNDDTKGAKLLYDATMKKFNALSDGVGKTKHDEFNHLIPEVRGLLELAGPVIEIKDFVLKYPNPSRTANPMPGKDEAKTALAERKHFANLKKSNNLALSIAYPFFDYTVENVDEKDVLILDQWGAILGDR